MKLPIVFIALLAPLAIAKEKWFHKMDLGPAWMNTFGDYFEGKKRVGAIKGISLDLGDGWRALFDTETLRLVTFTKAAWSGVERHGRGRTGRW